MEQNVLFPFFRLGVQVLPLKSKDKKILHVWNLLHYQTQGINAVYVVANLHAQDKLEHVMEWDEVELWWSEWHISANELSGCQDSTFLPMDRVSRGLLSWEDSAVYWVCTFSKQKASQSTHCKDEQAMSLHGGPWSQGKAIMALVATVVLLAWVIPSFSEILLEDKPSEHCHRRHWIVWVLLC